MNYLFAAIYGILGVIFIFFALAVCKKNRSVSAKEKAIYAPYDNKVKKVVPVFVRLSSALFGICMLGFCAAIIILPDYGVEGYLEKSILSGMFFSVSAYVLLIPVFIVVGTWIWMQFHRKKGKK